MNKLILTVELTPEQRETMILLQDKGLSNNDIFDMLGNVVKSWLDAEYEKIIKEK